MSRVGRVREREIGSLAMMVGDFDAVEQLGPVVATAEFGVAAGVPVR